MIETNGTVNLEDSANIKDPMVREVRASEERMSEAIRGRMSKEGALGLPAHLDKRRLAFGITDGAFRQAPSFDRVLVFQVPPISSGIDRYGDTAIIMPDQVKSREKDESPRGIIVGAGLTAMDSLVTHGMQLGDIVTFIKFSPFRIPTDCILGKWFYLMQIDCGDITGNEDVAERIRAGELTLQWDAITRQHFYAQSVARPIAPRITNNDL